MTTVLITGTSKGIGYESALVLARAGHEVIATMRNPGGSNLEKVAEEAGLPITVRELDVDDDASVDVLFDELAETVDVLVNNAGILSIETVEDESLDRIRQVMETNYFGAVRCAKRVLPAMRARGAGCIINVTSVAGRIALFGCGAYAASKFALEALTESLAQEVHGLGIRVALVEPGIIDTPMATSSLPEFDKSSLYPHGRRVHRFFRNPDRPEAPAGLVGDMIRHIIESDDPRLRFPVGPDAHAFLGWRGATSDEEWVRSGALASDEAYFERVLLDTGIDLREK